MSVLLSVFVSGSIDGIGDAFAPFLVEFLKFHRVACGAKFGIMCPVGVYEIIDFHVESAVGVFLVEGVAFHEFTGNFGSQTGFILADEILGFIAVTETVFRGYLSSDYLAYLACVSI